MPFKPSIEEPSRISPVTHSCDVVVVGGGIAGIAAALSAARAGANTILLEREYALGGLATLGLITYYLPLCDGMGQQVSFGIAEELMRLSVSLDDKQPDVLSWNDAPKPYEIQKRYRCSFNPAALAIASESLLRKNGVKILYGAQVCGACVKEARLKAVIIESISGRTAIQARSFVDASGDAVLCRCAGEATAVYNPKNKLAAWYYASELNGNYCLRPLGVADILPDDHNSSAEDIRSQKRYSCLDIDSQSEFIIDAHEALINDFLKSGKFSDQYQLSTIATIPQVRMTRRIVGAMELGEAQHDVYYPDSIGMISNWKCSGPVYEIPFSCLHGTKVVNLITAGRCISTDDVMWDNTRVIPAVAVTGEAAGLAAAISDNFCTMNVGDLQDRLKQRSIPLHHDSLAVSTWHI